MFTILGFYKFKKLNLLKKKRNILQNVFIKQDIRGTLIISKEGLNGTISGKPKKISFIKKKIKSLFKIKTFDSENLSKSIFSIKNIKLGTKITRSMLDIKSPGQGMSPQNNAEMIGKKVNKNI